MKKIKRPLAALMAMVIFLISVTSPVAAAELNGSEGFEIQEELAISGFADGEGLEEDAGEAYELPTEAEDLQQSEPSQEREPADLTERITLEASDWWYLDQNQNRAASETENKTVDMKAFIPEELEEAGQIVKETIGVGANEKAVLTPILTALSFDSIQIFPW